MPSIGIAHTRMNLVARSGRKAISPMISVVLLIAFTIAVAGILSLWLTTLASTQTTTTGTAAEKQILCSRSVLELREVTHNVVGTDNLVNITVVYSYGDENLYNFTLAFVDNARKSFTVNQTRLAQMSHQYNKTSGQEFSPGAMVVWNLNLTEAQSGAAGGDVLTGTSLQSVRVRALCQDDYPVAGECKSGQGCMK